MKVVLLNDTSGHANWGCQATSAGLKRLIRENWPEAELVARPAEKLPFAGQSWRRKWLNRRISKATLDPKAQDRLIKALKAFQVDPLAFEDADVVLLNGEGMIHGRSGHFFRLLGQLAAAAQKTPRVAIINQTVDVEPGSKQAELIAALFPKLDHVQVRDTESLALLQTLGAANAQLVPDAAFLTTPATDDDVRAARNKYGLPENYIALTGSSGLSKKDGAAFTAFCRRIEKKTGLPLILLASTKTDLRLGDAATAEGLQIKTFGPDTPLADALALIKGADMLIGGRFHPMIFAALSGTPLLGLSGNTHKTEGLLELLKNAKAALIGLDDPRLEALIDQEQDWGPELEARARILADELKAIRFFDEVAP